MSGLLAVLPAIATDPTDACVESLVMPDSAFGIPAADVLLVDNSRAGDLGARYPFESYRDPDGHNLGVARSWNIGARQVLDEGRDYLLIVSASMRFGPAMHTTWGAQMRTFWGADLIECDGHSWHLIAIHRSVFERVGLFDPAFWPGYEEAIDFCHRASKLGIIHWPRAWVNALSQGTGMALPHVDCPWEPLRDHYAAKWNGPKGAEMNDLPWGDKPLDYIVEEPVPVLAERYGVRRWW